MVVNADSLVMLDFARDVWMQRPIAAWNLPRAPYLFPDTLIVLLVLSVGWFTPGTFFVIAVIHLSLLVLLAHRMINRANAMEPVPIWQVAVGVAASIFLLGAFFPFAADHVLWQIFASGAHFLTVMVVMFLFDWVRPSLQNDGTKTAVSRTVFAMALGLTFAEALSDSLSVLLIFIWYGASVLGSQRVGLKRWTQFIALPITVVLATAASFLIPRQPLVGSFFSIEKFTVGIQLFFQWMLGSFSATMFMALLVITSIVFSCLLRWQLPRTFKQFGQVIFSNYTLPSLGVICATPLFYQEVASLRYLSLPALMLLIVLTVLGVRATRFICAQSFGRWLLPPFFLLWALVIYSGLVRYHLYFTKSDQAADINAVIGTVPPAKNAALAVQCIKRAAQQFALADGIATYWNARPTYFASQFEYYLGQASPWHPRSGYLLWGNNGIELVYRDGDRKRPRQYNYILANNDELRFQLWGSLADQSSAQLRCERHTVLYFDQASTLANYFFPFGPPFDISPAGKIIRANDQDRQWITGPYWGLDLFTLVGKREGKNIVATGTPGPLVYGPYITLTPGSYRLIVKGALTSPQRVFDKASVIDSLGLIDVVGQRGRLLMAASPIALVAPAPGVIAELAFEVKQTIDDAEFRIIINAGVTGEFVQYQLVKLAAN